MVASDKDAHTNTQVLVGLTLVVVIVFGFVSLLVLSAARDEIGALDTKMANLRVDHGQLLTWVNDNSQVTLDIRDRLQQLLDAGQGDAREPSDREGEGSKVRVRFEWRGESSLQNIPLTVFFDVFLCLGEDLQPSNVEEIQCIRDALEGLEWDVRVDEIILEFDGENWTVTIPAEAQG